MLKTCKTTRFWICHKKKKKLLVISSKNWSHYNAHANFILLVERTKLDKTWVSSLALCYIKFAALNSSNGSYHRLLPSLIEYAALVIRLQHGKCVLCSPHCHCLSISSLTVNSSSVCLCSLISDFRSFQAE